MIIPWVLQELAKRGLVPVKVHKMGKYIEESRKRSSSAEKQHVSDASRCSPVTVQCPQPKTVHLPGGISDYRHLANINDQ